MQLTGRLGRHNGNPSLVMLGQLALLLAGDLDGKNGSESTSKRRTMRKPRTKLKSPTMNLARPPEIGIVFVVGEKLFIDRTPVSKGEIYGHFKIHERGHDKYWEMLKQAGLVPQDSEYDNYPRGRVAYNTNTRRYSLFLDICILKKKPIVKEIMSQLNLPTNRTTTDTDSHYRCPRCLMSAGQI